MVGCDKVRLYFERFQSGGKCVSLVFLPFFAAERHSSQPSSVASHPASCRRPAQYPAGVAVAVSHDQNPTLAEKHVLYCNTVNAKSRIIYSACTNILGLLDANVCCKVCKTETNTKIWPRKCTNMRVQPRKATEKLSTCEHG